VYIAYSWAQTVVRPYYNVHKS